MTAVATVTAAQPRSTSLVAKLAAKYNVEPTKMLESLKATAFHSDKDISNEQMMALLIVADQYGLNPWTRELYAFPDAKKGGIVPIVSIDGWTRIINERPELQGIEFRYGPDMDGNKFKGAPSWIECVIHRSDRVAPTVVRERLVECFRETGPWQSHPSRMLRHKALMQAARVAFGFAGVYDPDEGERIVQGEVVGIASTAAVDDFNAKISGKPAPAALEHNPGEKVPTTIEGAQVETVEAGGAAPAVQAEAKVVKGGRAAGPTYPEVRNRLDQAKSIDDVDEAASLIGGTPSQFHAELSALAAKRREELQS